MMLIVLAAAKATDRTLRNGGVFVGSALLSAALFASGVSHAAPAKKSARAVTTSARAQGGNPPSYAEFGKRYHVLASSAGYRERGVASWYGHPFHGRPTSSGERYDMNEMTAAHTTLPLPTWVEVTNLDNGKRIIVKVNDRGPFVDKRLIDLSHAAASALDIVRAGTAHVEVRALDGPPRPTTAGGNKPNRSETAASAGQQVALRAPVSVPAAAPEATALVKADSPPRAPARSPPVAQSPPAAQPERLFAQAGRFTERRDAVELVDTLKAHGFVNAFIVTEDGRRKSMHRVRVGPLPDAAQVADVGDQLRELGAKRSQRVVMR
jgi:rare lipoprotein A